MKNLETLLMILYHVLNGAAELCWNGSEMLRKWHEWSETGDGTVKNPTRRKGKAGS